MVFHPTQCTIRNYRSWQTWQTWQTFQALGGMPTSRLGRDAEKWAATDVRLIHQSMERSVPYKTRPSLRATDREARLSHEVL